MFLQETGKMVENVTENSTVVLVLDSRWVITLHMTMFQWNFLKVLQIYFASGFERDDSN